MGKIIFEFGSFTAPDKKKLDLQNAARLCIRATEASKKFADVPMHQIWSVLEALSEKWQDRNNARRLRLKASLPLETGFSPEMIELGLNEIPNLLSPKYLKQKVEKEFQGIPRGLDGLHYNRKQNSFLRWHPLGSIIHILSGNVFLVGIGSFLEGILTGNATILKASSGENIFLPEFLSSLMEVEKELPFGPILSRSVALISYSSKNLELIDLFKKSVDGIVIWGGEEAVKAYRNDLPARTRAIVFGPKLSIGILARSALEEKPLKFYAKALASELAIWDQNACTAPQVFYVEGKGNAETFIDLLHVELEEIQKTLPIGKMEANVAAEIQKLRAVAEMDELTGNGKLKGSIDGLTHSIYLSDDCTLEPSPLNRTLKIVSVETLEPVLKQVSSLRAYVQTIGLGASKANFSELSESFGKLGVLRVMELGLMAGGAPDDPHDGAYDLPQMMNLVVTRNPSWKTGRVFEFLSAKQRKKIIQNKVESVLIDASKHPLYRDRLNGRLITDLKDWPILTKSDFFSWPASTEPKTGGAITRSGGTTGKISFSYFDRIDWEPQIEAGVEALLDLGFTAEDRIANLFSAGGMYGSFITFQDVNTRLGMTSYPFAASSEPEAFIEIWKTFGFNAIEGVPTYLVPFLRKCKGICDTLHFEKLIYAGLPLNPADEKWLRKELGVTKICSLLGTSESGLLAYRCNSWDENVYKVVEEYNHLEILADNGSLLEPSKAYEKLQFGDVVVTNLSKRAIPVVRFKIGDRGALFQEKDGTTKLKFSGRGDEILCFGHMNLSLGDIKKSLEKIEYTALQTELSYESKTEKFTLNLETNRKSLSPDEVGECLKLGLKGFKTSLNKGLFDLRINIFSPGGLPRNPITGKLKEIIDQRF